MDKITVAYLIAMLFCALLSGFFSATETAFATFNKARIKALAEEGNKRASLSLKLSDEEDSLMSTVLIGNTIANITIATLGTMLFVRHCGNWGALLSTVVVTLIVLIIGEITPKGLAKVFPETFTLTSAPLIRIFLWILYPLNLLFMLWRKLLSKLFRPKEDNKMSQEELLMLVDEAEQEGEIDRDESSLLRNVIEFNDLTAEEILTRRVNLVGFPKETAKEEIARIFSETKFSRLLVYEEDIDHIIGVLHQKDFYTSNGVTDKNIEELLSPPLFIPETENISDLLKLFQINQSHLAVVVDEYGETLGIVTMEDILEELVGEIWDEHDEVVEQIRQLDEDTFEVNCEISPEEFAKRFEILIETECSTLNGWIAEQLEKIPETDDLFVFDRLTIKVVETESRRATFANIKVAPLPQAEELVQAEQL